MVARVVDGIEGARVNLSARRVRVVSEHGSFTARLYLFEGAQPGLVHVPYGLHSRVEGWGTVEAVNPLAAVTDVRAALCGDVDGDGLPDIYLCREGPNQLWRHGGDDDCESQARRNAAISDASA